ncbi:cytochrome c biogenesis protein CcdA [Synechococcus sp. CBW1004]|jgi:cytochrome c-type biogenesis protein|uniref:cytochrome c biogenesis protein CcdA n=1 Tax=Synechococcus sp. CBW1004 TaxID=1353136 RepID=UPI001E3FEFEE|nr:cytochrome c biogenesis protein CcdA [Synechococcus sp. CBW1004]
MTLPSFRTRTPAAPTPWRSFAMPRLLPALALGLLTLVVVVGLGPQLSRPLEWMIGIAENRYQRWFDAQDTSHPVLLLSLAFGGGLLASLSPCILALLPVNLSYIGTLKLTSRRDAFLKAAQFVLGAVTILSLFGLVSSFAGAVLIDFRGYFNIGVGLLMALMGLGLAGWIRLPLPQWQLDTPITGPYGVGLGFALVSSPCASPVLFAVLAAAAASGSQVLAVLTMVSYALGYTALIFLASLFTGLARTSRGLLQHSEAIVHFGSLALVLTGLYYLWIGAHWFVGSG